MNTTKRIIKLVEKREFFEAINVVLAAHKGGAYRPSERLPPDTFRELTTFLRARTTIDHVVKLTKDVRPVHTFFAYRTRAFEILEADHPSLNDQRRQELTWLTEQDVPG